jgi:hypothetical protein
MDNQAMGPETVKIRRAGTEDLPGIMRLQLRSYEASLQEPASLFEKNHRRVARHLSWS